MNLNTPKFATGNLGSGLTTNNYVFITWETFKKKKKGSHKIASNTTIIEKYLFIG